MDERDREIILKLASKIADLERDNQALRNWVKILATQDAMLLEFQLKNGIKDESWKQDGLKIIDQIIDNSDTARGIEVRDE